MVLGKHCSKCQAAEALPYTHMCRPCYNARMNNYMTERYYRRRAAAIKELGGHCAKCRSRAGLEIDHIDRTLKQYSISKILASAPEARYQQELKKCQLLCRRHHKAKSSKEQSVSHGTGLTGRKNCRCELCRPLKNAYIREWKKKKRLQQLTTGA